VRSVRRRLLDHVRLFLPALLKCNVLFMYKNAVPEPSVASRQGFVRVANRCSHPLIHDCAASHHPCSEWAIGSKGGGGARLFIGHIADVQLWSVPLTRDHVASIFSDQAPPVPRPVARWMMDDDVGGKRAQVHKGFRVALSMLTLTFLRTPVLASTPVTLCSKELPQLSLPSKLTTTPPLPPHLEEALGQSVLIANC
jgi:hypothetical protein